MDVEKIAAGLSEVEHLELEALAEMNAALNGPSFTMRCNWPLYQKMVRKSLIEWTEPPAGFTKKRFAEAMVTPLGLAVHEYLENRNDL